MDVVSAMGVSQIGDILEKINAQNPMSSTSEEKIILATTTMYNGRGTVPQMYK